MDGEDLSEFFEESELGEAGFSAAVSPDDIFSLFEGLEGVFDEPTGLARKDGEETRECLASQKSASSAFQESEPELEASSPKCKRQKLSGNSCSQEGFVEGEHRMTHITVERNRRKQMNEHLTMLRSLMPRFYVKRGDQASIIGGVVDYINELQQILQSLEAKKQRKVYTEVLSPRLIPSPRPSPLSPRKPPLSPKLSLPISPRTPQSNSPYIPRLHPGYVSPSLASPIEPSPCSSSSSINDCVNELVASTKSAIAEVEVKFSGENVLLKTVSAPLPRQAVKIIAALEDLSLEILHVNINLVEQRMLNSFTIKIGIECRLSAEELAEQILQTFY